MTIVVDTDNEGAKRVEANLYKIYNVLLVEKIERASCIVRDLAMIKVACTHESRPHVLGLAVYSARGW